MKKKRVVEERIKREEKNKIKDIVRLHTQCMIHWIFLYNFFLLTFTIPFLLLQNLLWSSEANSFHTLYFIRQYIQL